MAAATEELESFCQGRLACIGAVKAWMERTAAVGAVAIAPGSLGTSGSADGAEPVALARTLVVAASTLAKLGTVAEGFNLLRAFCQAVLELDHWSMQQARSLQLTRRAAKTTRRHTRMKVQLQVPAHASAALESHALTSPEASSARAGSATGTKGRGVAMSLADSMLAASTALLVPRGHRPDEKATAGYGGMYPDGLMRLPRNAVLKPGLRRGARGQAVFEWLAPQAPTFAEPDLNGAAVVALEAIELVYRRLASISISEVDIPTLRSADSKLARLVIHPLVTCSVAAAEGAALEAIASLGTPQHDEWL